MVDGRQVGRIREDFVPRLGEFRDAFALEGGAVHLAVRERTPAARTAAMRGVVARLVAGGVLAKHRREDYPVLTEWGTQPLFVLDRSAVPLFGLRAFGVHVNGFVREGAGLRMWIGRRALDKAVEPGKLDNMVAGGQPAGLGLLDNLVKEAGEEAGVPPELARRARPVGALSYCMADERGLKPDTMFLYDLEVPADFVPRNTDGEISEFALMEVDEIAERVRGSYDFKFNVALVLIDFLIRHGYLTPENEPDYPTLAAGLHAPP